MTYLCWHLWFCKTLHYNVYTRLPLQHFHHVALTCLPHKTLLISFISASSHFMPKAYSSQLLTVNNRKSKGRAGKWEMFQLYLMPAYPLPTCIMGNQLHHSCGKLVVLDVVDCGPSELLTEISYILGIKGPESPLCFLFVHADSLFSLQTRGLHETYKHSPRFVSCCWNSL